MTSATKRARSTSLSSSDTNSLPLPSRLSSPATKYARFPRTQLECPSPLAPFTCTLPPTCSLPNRPTHLRSPQEVESHYANYHTHVCELPKCQSVFPNTRLLELHILECHDPITALRKERGEKTFACLVGPPTCTRVFSTPKGRRLHLINFHNYPKQYFFGIVNKGIGGLLKKWGPAASLYRGEWKTRKETPQDGNESEDEMDVAESLGLKQTLATNSNLCVLLSESTSAVHVDLRNFTSPTPPLGEKIPDSNEPSDSLQPGAIQDSDMADINDTSLRMASLSLIPDKVRFGRGGATSGFVRCSRRSN